MTRPVDTRKGTLLVVGRIGGQRFAWPVASVERIRPMAAVTPSADLPAGVVGFLDVHGHTLAVVDPRPALGLPPQVARPEQHLLQMSASVDNDAYLLWVDQVDDIVSSKSSDSAADEGLDEAETGLPRMVRIDGGLVRVLSAAAFEPRHLGQVARGPR